MGTTPHDDAFFRFLTAEGLLDDATIASGGDAAAQRQAAIDALAPDVLAAARERFARQQDSDAGPTVPQRRKTDPLLGQVIGGCRIEKLLGAGGMGAVYRATQLSIDRPVAFKVQKGEPHPDLVERFRSEARLLGRLHSPHIVDVYDVGTEGGLQYFVMEFMPGGSLSGHVHELQGQKLPRDDARRMLTECCLGLAEAAEHGVLHRDIKPDNLLLDGRGTVKIADFGIAKLLDAEYALTQTGFSPGTPAFKSPEQVAAAELDFRTDMYSLGVSFWMLMTGVRPADSLTRQEQLEQLDEPPPFSAPELAQAGGDPLLRIVCRMMALKRADRFASWQELIDALRSLADGAGAATPRAPAPVASPRGGRRLAVTAGVLAVAVVLTVAIWPRDDAPPANGGDGQGGAATPANGRDGTAATPTPDATGSRTPDTPTRPAAPNGADEGTRPTSNGTDAAPPGPAASDTAPQDPSPTTVDPDAAARRQFFADLGAPLPTSPRSAREVDEQLGRLTARASALGVADDPAWARVAEALERERTAARARDAVREVTALSAFGQHEELAAAAAAIELATYRDDAAAHVQALFAARPRCLRVPDADVAWLRGWADWELADGNTSTGERPLPIVVRDRRRGCRMVLVQVPGAPPAWLDATEVSLGQWRAGGRSLDGLQGPTDDDAPVRLVADADVDAFLAAHELRLPNVAELRAALGTRAGDAFWWGNGATPPAGIGINLADAARHREVPTAPYLTDHDDGTATLAPVDDARFAQGDGGRFRHLLGNVAETCIEDGRRVVLGGSFVTATWDALRSDQRQSVVNPRRQDVGFRAARTLGR